MFAPAVKSRSQGTGVHNLGDAAAWHVHHGWGDVILLTDLCFHFLLYLSVISRHGNNKPSTGFRFRHLKGSAAMAILRSLLVASAVGECRQGGITPMQQPCNYSGFH